jgi:MFS family permease
VSRFSRGFVLLLVVSTLGTLSSGVVAPVLPRFVDDELGGGGTLVGLVMGLPYLCSLLGGLLAGPEVDRVGRRVTALTGLSIALAGALLLIPADGAASTIVARAVYGVGTGIAATAIITWAVDEVPREWRGWALSVFGMTVWIGLSLGPQAGQAMFDAHGYRGVWALIAGLEAAAVLVAIAGREPVRPGSSPGRARPRGRSRLIPAGALRPAVSIGMAAYGEGVITAFLVLQLIDRGVHDGAGFGGAASVYTIFAVSVIVCRLAGGWLIDGPRPDLLAIGALAIEAAGLVILAFASSFGSAAAGAAVMGGGFAVLFPALALLATETSRDEERGAALGSFGSAFSLGLGLGSLLGGGVAALAGTGAAHLSAAVAAVAGIVVLAAQPRRPRVAVPLVERAP